MSTIVPSAVLCCLLTPLALAQKQVSRSFERITAPIRDAGVYHVASGTWTRPSASSSPALIGGTMDTVYACTSPSGYFADLGTGQVWSASGRIPSTTSPDILWDPAAFPDGSLYGSARGCADAYQIEGFQVSYCTQQTGPTVQMTLAFYESWNPICTSTLSTATPQGGPFALTGLPGRGLASMGCWVMTIDLSATSASFAFQADGDGSYSGFDDAFGWSFTFPSVTSTLVHTGPVLAGSPSDATGPGTACHAAHPGIGWPSAPATVSNEAAGYDGRRFDTVSGACSPAYPANLSSFPYPPMASTSIEGGSDMLGDDAFRIDGGSVYPGCHFYGGPASGSPPNGPYANFHLELYAKAPCTPPIPGVVEYCSGDGSVPTPCPCGNFGAPGNGCQSSFNPNGAHVTINGTSPATAHLDGTGMQPTGICVFLKGDTIAPNGFQFGDGITCTGGALIRLRSVALGVTLPNGAQFPVPPQTVTLAARGGNIIGSGQIASYTVFYRNSAAAFCPPFTFNAANNVQITW